MARVPKPWFREDRKTYCVTIRGKRHDLGPDKTEADRLFHELMARKPEALKPITAAGLSVAEVFDKYLDWCEKHREPRTFEWYRDHIQSFMDTLKEPDKMPVPSLKPFHVIEWTDAHPSWGKSYRRGAIVAVQRPFNWAERLGYIDKSPVRNIEKPPAVRREQVVTPVQFATIRDHYGEGDPFRDLLEFAWETGCRPQEVKNIEPRHVQMDKHCVAFPPAEAKGKKRWRIIYMTPRAEQIITGLLTVRSNGPLFLNAKGTRWNRWNMACRFGRLKKHVGATYCAYVLRHGFATRKLEEGLDHLTVAALLGHKDATMLAKIYSHIGERPDHLREQLNKASNVGVSK